MTGLLILPAVVTTLGLLGAWFALELAHDGGDITDQPIRGLPPIRPAQRNRRHRRSWRTWQPVSTAHLRHAETLRLIWAEPQPVLVAPSATLLYGRPPADVEVLRVAA